MPEGTSTLPSGLPKLTLGWGVIAHATNWLIQPNGPKAGQPWTPVDSQALFTLWWYALDDDGRWLYHHGVRRLAKGSGKSPFAAVLAIEELVGPVRLDHFDPDALGGCVGKPVSMPLVQIAATAESQTANTMRMVRAMAAKKSRVVNEYQIDVGKTVFYTPYGGQLEIITSSANAAEGAEVTFAIEDETEHWVPSHGGPALAGTLDRNLAKSSSRAIETANAWEPGAGSVAETTYDAWEAQEAKKLRGSSKILYDARVAAADTKLDDDESLTKALSFVYGDCFWVDLKTIKERVWDLRTGEDVSRRFYLNQPTAAEDAWTTPMAWAALEAAPGLDDEGLPTAKREIQDGEEIVVFFDGSESRDATGLVGCAMSDGHIFTIGVWELTPRGDDRIPTDEVDATVEAMFDRWDVLAFFADVKEWEGFTKITWPQRYKDRLLIHSVPSGQRPQVVAWDMRSHAYDFTLAAELTETEIRESNFTHDGNRILAQHVANARRKRGQYGMTIKKETPDSPKKIDLAVCMVGARYARRKVLESKEWERRQRKSAGRGRVIVLA